MNDQIAPQPVNDETPRRFPLYVVSGGVGATGEQLARTVLAQFQSAEVALRIFPKVFHKRQVRTIFESAADECAIVLHTFVDPRLRRSAQKYAQRYEVSAIDLFGSLIDLLNERLKQEPLGKPGLYRQLHHTYFDRIDAMDYTLAHDDGQRPQGWPDAEIVLVGVSRVGKTPISLYLSILGWKVANVPIVSGLQLPPEFTRLDVRRVVGLMIAPSELLEHRLHRQSHLGVGVAPVSDYVDPAKVYEEIESVKAQLRRMGIPTIDVTAKPIETSADEVIRLVKRRLKLPPASSLPPAREE
jgi:hypothetical protein